MGILYPLAIDTFSVPTLPEATSLSSAGTSRRNHTESHDDLGKAVEALQTNAAQLTHNHSGDGSAFGTFKLEQANTHQTPDTDLSGLAIHHTLGYGATQAAAGNHIHDYEGPTITNKPLIICTSSTRPVSPQLGLMIYETDTNCVRVWAEFSPNNFFDPTSEVNVEVLFTGVYNTSLGPDWDQSYLDGPHTAASQQTSQDQSSWVAATPQSLLNNGALASPNGAGAEWVVGNDVPFRCIARRINPNDAVTRGDDQIITAQWGTPDPSFYYYSYYFTRVIESTWGDTSVVYPYSVPSIPVFSNTPNYAMFGYGTGGQPGAGAPGAGGVGSIGAVPSVTGYNPGSGDFASGQSLGLTQFPGGQLGATMASGLTSPLPSGYSVTPGGQGAVGSYLNPVLVNPGNGSIGAYNTLPAGTYWTDPQGHMLQMRDDGLSNPVSAPQQQTTMVASSTNVYDYHATGSVPGMDIYLRMSADKQSYIRVTFDFFNYTIFYTTAGPTKEINIGSGLSTVVPGVVHQPASWLDVLTWTVKVLDNSVYVYANYPLNSLLGGTAGGQQGTYLLGAHPDILQGRVLRGDGYRGWGYGAYGTTKSAAEIDPGSGTYTFSGDNRGPIDGKQGKPATLLSIEVTEPPIYSSRVIWQLLPVGNTPSIRAEANASQSIIPTTGSVLETGLTIEDWVVNPFKVNQTDIVIREAGHYDINVSASWDPNYYDFDSAMISAEVNGEDISRKSQSAMRGNGTAPGFAQTSSLSFHYYFALGDVVRFRLSHNGTQPAKTAYIVAAPDRHTSWFELIFRGP